MGVGTIVFDFGNVLGFFSRKKAATQLAAYANGVSVDAIIEFLFETDLEYEFECGRLRPLEVITCLRRQFGLSGTDAELMHAYADMFSANAETCQLVEDLGGRYRLVLLSNTNAIHYHHFRQQFAPTLGKFDLLVASHEVGYRKPDSRIFRHVERQLECPAAECLFIDDLAVNIEAAQKCGWQGIVYGNGVDLRWSLAEAGVASLSLTP